MLKNFKSIIAPLQTWLLDKGQCVGCGNQLVKVKREDRKNNEEKVICKCGRIYIFNKKTKKYKRALTSEI